jgi:hypothetical protein
MMRRWSSIVFALGLIATAGAALAQSGGAVNESPEQNVRAYQQYQQLTCTNKAFRQHRIEKECGPLQGSEFYDSCVASFDCGKQPSAAGWRNTPPSQTVK